VCDRKGAVLRMPSRPHHRVKDGRVTVAHTTGGIQLTQHGTTSQPRRITVEYVLAEALRPATYNPRRISDAERTKLERSLLELGFVDPVIARRANGEVIGGHQRLEAARRLGIAEVPVVYLDDLTDEQARLLNLALNRIHGEWDICKLGRLLMELGTLPDIDLSLGGFDLPEMSQSITAFLRERSGRQDEEEVPPVPETPVTRPGDRWHLGDHRVLCADATETHVAEPESVDVLWTDPPYGVSYTGGTRESLTMQGDDASGIAELLQKAFARADTQLKPGARIYVAHPAGPLSISFGQEFMRAGWHLHQTLIWVKDSIVLGRSDYHYRHEPVLYGYKPGQRRTGRGARGWYGDNRQASVFEIPRPKASLAHPTIKPVRLVEAHLVNSSQPGDLVLDPFLGSGTTLIACEKLGRRCCGADIDPRYVDVAVRR